GNLKLAYAQFEELETFARFGTRLDDHTKNIIEHGKRIRLLFKQPELAPVSVPEQLMVLLSLTSGLFDLIPLDKIKDAEVLIKKSSLQIPADVLQRIYSSEPLSQDDENLILSLAKESLQSIIKIPETKINSNG
ncbi:MAG: hypothetical protein ABI325_03900, partial [Ginsengibacter sp.]